VYSLGIPIILIYMFMYILSYFKPGNVVLVTRIQSGGTEARVQFPVGMKVIVFHSVIRSVLSPA
jgi:hypothetical protein